MSAWANLVYWTFGYSNSIFTLRSLSLREEISGNKNCHFKEKTNIKAALFKCNSLSFFLANFIHTLFCSDKVWARDHTTSPKKSYKKLTLLFFQKRNSLLSLLLIFQETKSSNITAFLTDLTIEIGNYRKLIVDIVRSFKTNVSTLYQQKHRFFVFHVK